LENKQDLDYEIVRGTKINSNLDLIARKLNSILNFKNDFNLTNSSVQIQIILKNLDHFSKINANYTDKADNATKKNKNEDFEMDRKVSISDINNRNKLKELFSPLRFKETSSFFSNSLSLSKNQIRIIKLEKEEDEVKKKLDFVLFENINKSRKIFIKLKDIYTLLERSEQEKFACEQKLISLTNKDINLKEALAELEIKIRSKN